ncbi:MAG: pitrilysin family protein [Elusimicrobiaceae bacterium]|nr:pitrilysin family protein [Elusimicrobiaceae bacterium]
MILYFLPRVPSCPGKIVTLLMMPYFKPLVLLSALLLPQPRLAFAEEPPSAKQHGAAVRSAQTLPPVTKTVYKNGLTLLVLENHVSPAVSFKVFFRAGSIDNPSGRTGLAHLFEHMIFKGTRGTGTKNYRAEAALMPRMDELAARLNDEAARPGAQPAKLAALRGRLNELEREAGQYITSNEMQKIYSGIGAYGLNAFTSPDVTWYTVSLPANRVEDWMILESDRFKNPVLREFYSERDVVLEELRINQSNPESRLYYALMSAAFSASPYRNPIIGWESDVARLLRPQAEEFFRTYYGPNNATIAIVGDVNAEEVKILAGKYFGDIEPRPLPDRTLTKEPLRDGEHRNALAFPSAPALRIAFNRPDMFSEDAPALALISSLLCAGRTSRLYKNMVENKQLAAAVSCTPSFPGSREASLFYLAAAPRAPHTAAEVEAAVYDELDRLKTIPAPQTEITKALNRHKADLVKTMENNSGMSRLLGMSESIFGDWAFQWKFLARLEQVAPQDIMRAAKRCFKPENRSVAWIENEPGKKAAR